MICNSGIILSSKGVFHVHTGTDTNKDIAYVRRPSEAEGGDSLSDDANGPEYERDAETKTKRTTRASAKQSEKPSSAKSSGKSSARSKSAKSSAQSRKPVARTTHAVKKPRTVPTKRKRQEVNLAESNSDDDDNDDDNFEDDPEDWSDEGTAPSPSPVKPKKARKKPRTTKKTARKKLEVQPAAIDRGALTRSVLAEQDTALSMGAKLRKAIAGLQVMFEWSDCL